MVKSRFSPRGKHWSWRINNRKDDPFKGKHLTWFPKTTPQNFLKASIRKAVMWPTKGNKVVSKVQVQMPRKLEICKKIRCHRCVVVVAPISTKLNFFQERLCTVQEICKDVKQIFFSSSDNEASAVQMWKLHCLTNSRRTTFTSVLLYASHDLCNVLLALKSEEEIFTSESVGEHLRCDNQVKLICSTSPIS